MSIEENICKVPNPVLVLRDGSISVSYFDNADHDDSEYECFKVILYLYPSCFSMGTTSSRKPCLAP